MGETVKQYLARIGKKGGQKGGPAGAQKLSANKRRSIAKKAERARWKDSREPSTVPQ